jgi:hypothetical protein
VSDIFSMVWMDGWLWIELEDECKIGSKTSRNGNNDIGRQDRHRCRHSKRRSMGMGGAIGSGWNRSDVGTHEIVPEAGGLKWNFEYRSLIGTRSIFRIRPSHQATVRHLPSVHPATQMSEDRTNITGKRAQYNRRFVNVTLAPGGKRRM